MATKMKSSSVAKKSQRPLVRVEGLPGAASLAKAVRFDGTELVSQPFSFSLELEISPAIAAKPKAIAEACLGRALGIELSATGQSRWFHGEIAGVHLNELGGTDNSPTLVLELRPSLWRLSRSMDTRLFVDKTAQQIIDAILCEHGLTGKFSWRIAAGHTFKPQPHCWQYEESDLDFVARLLAEEGIRYWFTFARTSHQLILSNGPGEVAACAEALGFGSGDPEADNGRPCVSFLRRSWNAAPATYVVRGRSPLEPGNVVEGRSSDTARQLPPGANGTLYDTDSSYHEVSDCRTAAGQRLDATLGAARTIDGESNVCRLSGGQFVKIDTRKPKPGLDWLKRSGGTRLRLLVVHHSADEGTKLYHNRFEAIPDDAPFISHNPPQQPRFAGTTAAEIVAGPDEHGRYQLKFDLDRTGRTSSWVPMAHPEEIVFLPRVSERVGVEFVQGNLDRPVIRDRLHTAATFPFDPKTNSRLGGITTPAHKLWFESGDARWALLEITGRLRELVKGNRETVIEKDVIEKVLGAMNCTVEKSWAGKVGQQYGMEAKEVLFKAAERIVLMVGKSCIVIDSGGVTINGAPLLHLNPPGGANSGTPAAPVVLPEAPKPNDAKAVQAKPVAKSKSAPTAQTSPADRAPSRDARLARLTPEQQAELAKLPPDKQAAVLTSLTPWFLKPGATPPMPEARSGLEVAVDHGNSYLPQGLTGYEPPSGLEVNPDPFNKPVLTLDEIGEITTFVAGIPNAPGFTLPALQGCLTSTPPTTPAEGFGFVACQLLPNLTGDSKQVDQTPTLTPKPTPKLPKK